MATEEHEPKLEQDRWPIPPEHQGEVKTLHSKLHEQYEAIQRLQRKIALSKAKLWDFIHEVTGAPEGETLHWNEQGGYVEKQDPHALLRALKKEMGDDN